MEEQSTGHTKKENRSKRKSASKTENQKAKEKDFLVVGIGASAGGVRALQEFFATMPPASGMAFVVVLHLSPEHKSSLPEIISAHTAMPVSLVDGSREVEPDNIYVIPPNRHLEMVDGPANSQPRGHSGVP